MHKSTVPSVPKLFAANSNNNSANVSSIASDGAAVRTTQKRPNSARPYSGGGGRTSNDPDFLFQQQPGNSSARGGTRNVTSSASQLPGGNRYPIYNDGATSSTMFTTRTARTLDAIEHSLLSGGVPSSVSPSMQQQPSNSPFGSYLHHHPAVQTSSTLLIDTQRQLERTVREKHDLQRLNIEMQVRLDQFVAEQENAMRIIQLRENEIQELMNELAQMDGRGAGDNRRQTNERKKVFSTTTPQKTNNNNMINKDDDGDFLDEQQQYDDNGVDHAAIFVALERTGQFLQECYEDVPLENNEELIYFLTDRVRDLLEREEELANLSQTMESTKSEFMKISSQWSKTDEILAQKAKELHDVKVKNEKLEKEWSEQLQNAKSLPCPGGSPVKPLAEQLNMKEVYSTCREMLQKMETLEKNCKDNQRATPSPKSSPKKKNENLQDEFTTKFDELLQRLLVIQEEQTNSKKEEEREKEKKVEDNSSTEQYQKEIINERTKEIHDLKQQLKTSSHHANSLQEEIQLMKEHRQKWRLEDQAKIDFYSQQMVEKEAEIMQLQKQLSEKAKEVSQFREESNQIQEKAQQVVEEKHKQKQAAERMEEELKRRSQKEKEKAEEHVVELEKKIAELREEIAVLRSAATTTTTPQKENKEEKDTVEEEEEVEKRTKTENSAREEENEDIQNKLQEDVILQYQTQCEALATESVHLYELLFQKETEIQNFRKSSFYWYYQRSVVGRNGEEEEEEKEKEDKATSNSSNTQESGGSALLLQPGSSFLVKCKKCQYTRETYNDIRRSRQSGDVAVIVECKHCHESHREWEFVKEQKKEEVKEVTRASSSSSVSPARSSMELMMDEPAKGPASLRFRAFLQATSSKFEKFWADDCVGLAKFISPEAMEKIRKTEKRQGRGGGGESWKLPMETLMEVFSFLPKRGSEGGKDKTILRVAMCCFLSLCIVRENPNVVGFDKVKTEKREEAVVPICTSDV